MLPDVLNPALLLVMKQALEFLQVIRGVVAPVFVPPCNTADL